MDSLSIDDIAFKSHSSTPFGIEVMHTYTRSLESVGVSIKRLRFGGLWHKISA